MIPTAALAVSGPLAALLGMGSYLAVFTRIEWHVLAALLPFLIWVYSAIALLLF